MNNNTVDDFEIGQKVNVEFLPGDLFDEDFFGTVQAIEWGIVNVEDENGDIWECDPEQLTHALVEEVA